MESRIPSVPEENDTESTAATENASANREDTESPSQRPDINVTDEEVVEQMLQQGETIATTVAPEHLKTVVDIQNSFRVRKLFQSLNCLMT